MLPKLNSAHGPETRNIINRAIELLNQQGESIQDLVAEGQLTPEQYSHLISAVNSNVKHGEVSVQDIDKTKGLLDETFISESLKQQMAGNTPISSVPADESVTKNKMLGDINLHSLITGVLLGPKITINYEDGNIDIPPNLRFVNSYGNYIISGGYSLDMTQSSGNTHLLAFRHSDSMIVRLDYNNNINYRNHSIIGVISETYKQSHIMADYKVVGEDPRTAFNMFNTTLIASRENIEVNFKSKILTTHIDGRPLIMHEGDTINFTAGNYDFSAQESVFFLAYDRDNGEFYFIDHVNSDGSAITHIDFDNTMILGLINQGTEQAFINGVGYSVIKDEIESGGAGLSQLFYFLNDPGGLYSSSLTEDFVSTGSRADYNAFMALYEDLESRFPEYVSKTKIGESTQGHVMYRYNFNYYDIMNPVDDKPIIYLNSSLHGVEMDAHYPVYSFLKNLCEDWLSNELLGWIHNNVHIVVVPLSNPDSFVNNQRKNSNDVDINRNFPHGWNNNDNLDSSSLYYPGTGPVSEVETQIIVDLIEEIQPYAMFDFHNNGKLESVKDLISISSGNDKLRYFIKAFGNSFDYLVRKDFPEIADWHYLDKYNFVMDRLQEYPGSMARYGQVEGYNSMIVEFTTGWEGADEMTHQKINRDALGNLILGVMRSTDRL